MSSQKVPLWQQLLAKRQEWLESQPSLSGQLAAIGREAVKDIRSTMHETFFGRPEHVPEMGTPLNPTPQMTTQDLGMVHGHYDPMLDQSAMHSGEQQQKGFER